MPQAEILLFDIGNTSIKVGLASREAVLTSYSLRTDAGQTADSLGLNLLTLLGHAGLPVGAIQACVASSVVPGIEPLLQEACRRFLGCTVLFAPHDIPVPLVNEYERPHEVGADRLVGAYAARRLFPQAPALIAIDFGTAVTFDCITGNRYMGGLIFPGPLTALAALASNAARLPRVNLNVQSSEPVVGKNTSTSIQHGLIFGFASMVEGLTARLRRQMPEPAVVVATGGFAADMARVSACFDHVLPTLLLDGLRRLYYEWQAQSPQQAYKAKKNCATLKENV